MQTSEAITELAKALSKAQGEISNAIKNSANPHFKSRYADLAAIWDVIREPFAKNGLSVIQSFDVAFLEKGGAVVTTKTLLMHSSGQYFQDEFPLRVGKDDPQAIGSATTYGRRYTLQAIGGVAGEDDDGNAASGKGAAPPVAAISAKQQAEILALLKKVNKEEAAFAAHMGVATIAEIPSISFSNAIAILQRIEAKIAKDAEKAAQPAKETQNAESPAPTGQ
jgi:hypothetical protein